MKVLVTGGRKFNNRELVFLTLDQLHTINGFSELIHGDANGADRLAGEWAYSMAIPVRPFPAKWKKHGKAAGPIRNQEMIDTKPDLVIAFEGGIGTADMVRRAKQAGIEVVEIS